MRTAKVFIFAMIILKHRHLRRIWHIAGRSTRKEVMLPMVKEMRRCLTSIWGSQANKMLRIFPVSIQIVICEFGTYHFPMRTFKPHVGLVRGVVNVHIKIPNPKTFWLQAPDDAVGTFKTICLQYHKIAVGVHRFNPAHPLACCLVI